VFAGPSLIVVNTAVVAAQVAGVRAAGMLAAPDIDLRLN